ncbi:thioesterase II family protein [Streptomyces lydicus]|uniref:thioesterase II family protein n=1 Tax=Streptomyces lydicus TaxID=47763 RepID=UPI0036A82AE1
MTTAATASAIHRANPWIHRYHPAPDAALTLVCFPHAGGSATFYHPVSRALSPQVEVVAVQYPGRQERYGEPAIDNLAELADRAHEALAPLAGRPLALFGHSMGAVVAFEVARRMERDAGAGPRALFLSGRRAPSCRRGDRVSDGGDVALIRELRLLRGTDPAMLDDPEIVEMILPALRADYRAIESHRCPPDAAVRCPVTVLTGDADPHTTVEEARAWSGHTTGGCDTEIFPGGHFFLADRSADVLAAVARRLRTLAATA